MKSSLGKILLIFIITVVVCTGFLSYREQSNKIQHLEKWVYRDTNTINNLLEELNNFKEEKWKDY